MRTDEKLREICDMLRRNYGDFHASVRQCGVSIDFVTNWIKDDKVAAEQIEEAQRVGYMGLESAMIQRGVHGVEKDIYYKGEVVGQEKQYSDSLLIKVAEANIPKYKKGDSSQATFNGPTQINIMPRADNYDDWLAMKKTTLQDRADAKAALMAPKVPEIIQGDFVEVSRPLAHLEGLL